MYRYFLSVIAIAVASSAGNAHQLTPEQALSRAGQIYRTSVSAMSAGGKNDARPQLVYTIADPQGKPTLYVFNLDSTRPDGYIITAARDEIEATVLAYADSGSFDARNIPDNMRWWLNQYSEQIQYTSATTASTPSAASATDTETRTAIQPLIKTNWGQEDPYNELCPVVNGVRCPTGCVATAMAQILKYYNYPAKATGIYSYKPSDVDHTISLDLDTVPLNWNLMTGNYNSSSSDEEKNAVANLMYACGVAIHMDYTPNSSGGNYTAASKALVNSFGFNRSLRYVQRNYYPYEQWEELLYDQLANNRPVLYCGSGDEGGHAFIVDGYSSDNYFHINWGWNGVSNGYFLITALNPEVQGVGGDASGFNISQSMVLDLMPSDGTDADYYPVIEFISGISTAKNTIARTHGTNVTFRDTHGIFNQSVGEVTVTMGVKVSSADDGSLVRYIPEPKTRKFISGEAIVSFSIPVDSFPAQGSYIVEPAILTADRQWISGCLVDVDRVRYLNLTASPQSLYFISEDDASINVTDLKNESPLYGDRTYIISARLDSPDDEYLTTVRPYLIRDNKQKAHGQPVEVDILPGEPQTITWVGTFSPSVETGNYELTLINGNGNIICEPIDVEILPDPGNDTRYTASASILGDDMHGQTEDDPAEVSPADFTVRIHIQCTEGYFADNVFAQLRYSESTGIRTVGGRYIGLGPGQSADVDLTDNISDLQSGHTYIIIPWAKNAKQIARPLYFRYNEMSGIEPVEAPHQLTVTYDPYGTTVHISSPQPVTSVSVFNIAGVEVLRHAPSVPASQISFDIGPLTPAPVILVANMSDGSAVAEKIILK